MNDRRLFALSDPHLSFHADKPMDVFGPRWDEHPKRIAANWREVVGPDDIVLIPGDLSWAMRLPDAIPDLEWLASLPGRKVMIRGNHDYWWPSLGKLNKLGLPNMHFIHNSHVVLDGVAIGGSRMWDFPGIRWGFVPTADDASPAAAKPTPRQQSEDPEKIRARELERLAASLGGLPADAALRVAMTHYPPIGEDGLPTMLTDRIASFDIDLCVFGHIHAPSDRKRPGEDVIIGKTRYVLASSDHLDHTPLCLCPI